MEEEKTTGGKVVVVLNLLIFIQKNLKLKLWIPPKDYCIIKNGKNNMSEKAL